MSKYDSAAIRKRQDERLKKFGITPRRGRPPVPIAMQRAKQAARKRRQREIDKAFCLKHFGCVDPDTVIRKMRRGEIPLPRKQEA